MGNGAAHLVDGNTLWSCRPRIFGGQPRCLSASGSARFSVIGLKQGCPADLCRALDVIIEHNYIHHMPR
jgi:hypothetical protein